MTPSLPRWSRPGVLCPRRQLASANLDAQTGSPPFGRRGVCGLGRVGLGDLMCPLSALARSSLCAGQCQRDSEYRIERLSAPGVWREARQPIEAGPVAPALGEERVSPEPRGRDLQSQKAGPRVTPAPACSAYPQTRRRRAGAAPAQRTSGLSGAEHFVGSAVGSAQHGKEQRGPRWEPWLGCQRAAARGAVWGRTLVHCPGWACRRSPLGKALLWTGARWLPR
jgi:hypothetical protein